MSKNSHNCSFGATNLALSFLVAKVKRKTQPAVVFSLSLGKYTHFLGEPNYFPNPQGKNKSSHMASLGRQDWWAPTAPLKVGFSW